MSEEILLPDGTFVTMPVVELHDAEADPAPAATSNNAFDLLEKARTVSGSTAAAGSDFFNVYRKQRARELERLEKMDEAAKEAELERLFQETRKQRIQAACAKTAKNAEKRKRRKENRRRRNGGQVVVELKGEDFSALPPATTGISVRYED